MGEDQKLVKIKMSKFTEVILRNIKQKFIVSFSFPNVAKATYLFRKIDMTISNYSKYIYLDKICNSIMILDNKLIYRFARIISP